MANTSVAQTSGAAVQAVAKTAQAAVEKGHEVKLKVKLKVKPKSADYRRKGERG